MALAVDEDRKVRRPVLLRDAAGPLHDRADLHTLSLDELFEAAQHVMAELKDRVVSPDFVETLEPAAPHESSPVPSAGVTLPQVQAQMKHLCRVVEGVQTAVVGHTDRAFQDPQARHRLLGLPVGKTGFRSTAEFLEQTQHTPQRETRGRVNRAAQHLAPPASGVGTAQGSTLPEVSNALWDGSVDPAVVDLITRTLTDARRAAERAGARRGLVEELIAAGQERLMARARDATPSAVRTSCRRWRLQFDQAVERSGAEQTASQSHLARSVKFVGEENGLYLWHLRLTQGQHEVMKTVVSAGSNPRSRTARADRAQGGAAGRGGADGGVGPAHPSGRSGCGVTPSARGPAAPARTVQGLLDLSGAQAAADEDSEVGGSLPRPPSERWEDRQRREVDAVMAALQAALTVKDREVLPDAGGARPQILVTIDFQTLAGQLAAHPDLPPPPPVPQALADQHPPGALQGPMVSHGAFTGPIDPRIIRMWACDADLLPVVLGGEGQVMDIGRRQRVFPPDIRRAIIARDRGCAAPGCDFPPSWCEVHHVRFWTEHEGPTSVDNGVLLCSHHHHALHFGQLEIHMRSGVPWFEDTSPNGRSENSGRAEPVLRRNPHWHD